MQRMSENTKALIREALLNDSAFDFKKEGNALRYGICPECGQRECFVSLDLPGRVKCGRDNNCKYSQKTTEIYKDLFENLAEKFPPTEKNPFHTAEKYLEINRGFDLNVIAGMFTQAAKKLSDGSYGPTVRVDIYPGIFWERLIDSKDVVKNIGYGKNKGSKNRVVGKYKGLGWIPPKQTADKGDEIFITEAIFKAMAFLHIGRKAISALSSTNLPREYILGNKGKNITWILAYDNDNAGRKNMPKFKAWIKEQGEKCEIIFPESGLYDWDDEFRADRLDDDYIIESYWRGYYYTAPSAQMKAFFHWVKYRKGYHVFRFRNALYRYKINSQASADEDNQIEWGQKYKFSEKTGFIPEYYERFCRFSEVEKISNCLPEHLYIEQDAVTDDIYHNFKISYQSGNPAHQVIVDGSVTESASTFKKAVAAKTYGGSFYGHESDYRILHDNWFSKEATLVTALPFVGYHIETGVYVFKDFGYYKNNYLPVNTYGFLETDKLKLKTSLSSVKILNVRTQDLSWISDYIKAFDYNGMVLLSWWVGSLFAEQIRRIHKVWPFLEYTGEHGAGKSTQIEFLWKCLGRNYEGLDHSESTQVGSNRTFEQLANMPVVLMEGDREDATGKIITQNLDRLKKLFEGRGIRAKGVKKRGADTEEPPFRGAILISQNASVDGSRALLSRIVHCNCTAQHFTDETRDLARRLEMMKDEDLGGFLHAVLSKETRLLSAFEANFEKVLERFREHRNIETRIQWTHAQIAAWSWTLPIIFGSAVSEDVCRNIEAHIVHRMEDRQRRIGADHPVITLFWELYDYYHIRPQNKVETEMLSHSQDPAEIAINLNHFKDMCLQNNPERLSMIDLKRLLPHSRRYPFIEQRKVRSRIFGRTTHCWVFKNTDHQVNNSEVEQRE